MKEIRAVDTTMIDAAANKNFRAFSLELVLDFIKYIATAATIALTNPKTISILNINSLLP